MLFIVESQPREQQIHVKNKATHFQQSSYMPYTTKIKLLKCQGFFLFQNFAFEIQTNEIEELEYDYVVQELRKAGGANYGTGSRD